MSLGVTPDHLPRMLEPWPGAVAPGLLPSEPRGRIAYPKEEETTDSLIGSERQDRLLECERTDAPQEQEETASSQATESLAMAPTYPDKKS